MRTPRKISFCCIRFIYTYLTKQVRYSLSDPAPPFVQGAVGYAYILHPAFVALDIFGGVFMRIVRLIPVLFECYSIGKWRGVLAWCKYLCGVLSLSDLSVESLDFSLGGCDG